jgi:adenine-specific DNA-methyltransferase
MKAVTTERKTGRSGSVAQAAALLHEKCGIYTKSSTVSSILDGVKWKSSRDLSAATLLEPAAGDGAFIVEAAERLVDSLDRRGIRPATPLLGDRIRAFELHKPEATRARERVVDSLRLRGIHVRTAQACAKLWVQPHDFLITKGLRGQFTHVVGNPPYVRWSKIPPVLRAQYARSANPGMGRGDLFLPFLDFSLEALKTGGRCGFVCSDRWRYMAFADAFRRKWLPQLEISSEESVASVDVFVRDVDAYPTVFIARKMKPTKPSSRPRRSRSKKKTLAELGYTIRVGPALGPTSAFVLDREERPVEQHLLHNWVDSSEIRDGRIVSKGRRVIAMHDSRDGRLRVLNRYSKLKKRLHRYKKQLQTRSIVRQGARWYSSIDRVKAVDWKAPKILVPELSKKPRCAIDKRGRIPSHGVYAIFSPRGNIDKLYRVLRNGGLAEALKGIAPRVKNGHVRCYRRFLLQIRVDVNA